MGPCQYPQYTRAESRMFLIFLAFLFIFVLLALLFIFCFFKVLYIRQVKGVTRRTVGRDTNQPKFSSL